MIHLNQNPVYLVAFPQKLIVEKNHCIIGGTDL